MNIDTIMIVDDDEVAHMTTESVIEEFDPTINILQAYDGQEALEILDKLAVQPNIILLDINMPRMNGFEFLEEYKTREHKSGIIAIQTSSNNDKDKERAKRYDFVTKYLLKPINISDLEDLRKL